MTQLVTIIQCYLLYILIISDTHYAFTFRIFKILLQVLVTSHTILYSNSFPIANWFIYVFFDLLTIYSHVPAKVNILKCRANYIFFSFPLPKSLNSFQFLLGKEVVHNLGAWSVFRAFQCCDTFCAPDSLCLTTLSSC